MRMVVLLAQANLARFTSKIQINMSLSKLSPEELTLRLKELHHEAAPKKWSSTQVLARLVELEGADALTSPSKVNAPLRQWEIDINKAARRKSELTLLMQSRLNMTVNQYHTIAQLRVHAMTRAMELTPGHPQDHVGFGTHSELTYQEVAIEFPQYLQWVIVTSKEEQTCLRFQRLAAWAQTSECAQIMEKGVLPPKDSKGTKKTSKSAASSKMIKEEHPEMDQLIQQVNHLSKEMAALKSQKARKTKSDVEDCSSSEWDKMSTSPP